MTIKYKIRPEICYFYVIFLLFLCLVQEVIGPAIGPRLPHINVGKQNVMGAFYKDRHEHVEKQVQIMKERKMEERVKQLELEQQQLQQQQEQQQLLQQQQLQQQQLQEQQQQQQLQEEQPPQNEMQPIPPPPTRDEF